MTTLWPSKTSLSTKDTTSPSVCTNPNRQTAIPSSPWCSIFMAAVFVSAHVCGQTATTAASACLRGSTRLWLPLTTGLLPEHKLPAPIDDAVSAVEWLQREALMSKSGDCDAWMGGTADFDRVFIVGDSSGGNMAHHLAVRLGTGSAKVAPVRVRGYVLLAPFFGGVERTRSEEGPCEALLSLDILDRFWRLSMPAGETRDHPLVNPFGPNSPNLEKVALDPILVIVGGDEILKDRVESYWRKLKELGKKIEYVEFEGQQHGFLTADPYSEVSNEALQFIKRFMIENSN
ncbi:putative carboxylesterase 15 [Prunus yedoensis var. nudiflora]|uniref:Putative carboxylesterase 15 n=1 Tax=Prunus yedoensis var. nudiflora TaxID=2094558 RepID=A0A314UFP5_PRUYE|nr:putative carboxylesterase 15 [Prunus yedoensis var. nudiflora]